MEASTELPPTIPQTGGSSVKQSIVARQEGRCRRSAKPHQGSQWAVFPLPLQRPTILSSLFEQLLLQHTPRLSSTAEAAASAAALSTGVAKGMSNGGRVQSNKRSNPDAPPARPVSMPGRLPVQSSASSTPQASTSRHERQGPPHLSAARPERQRTRTAPASPRATPDAEPPAKRQRGLVSDASVPSLLSRMALASSAHERAAATVPAKRRAESEGNPRPRRTPPSRQSPTEAEAVPPGGWSIKGAARAQQPEEAKEQAASLLDRLKQNDHGGGGNSRRKRTKT